MLKNLRLELFSSQLLFYFFSYSSFSHFSTLSGPLFSSLHSDNHYLLGICCKHLLFCTERCSHSGFHHWMTQALPLWVFPSTASPSAQICSPCCQAGVQGPSFQEPFVNTVLSLPGPEQPGLPAESFTAEPLAISIHLLPGDPPLPGSCRQPSLKLTYPSCAFLSEIPDLLHPAGHPVVSQRRWELLAEPTLYSWPPLQCPCLCPDTTSCLGIAFPSCRVGFPVTVGVGLLFFSSVEVASLNCFLPLIFKLVPIFVFSFLFLLDILNY